MPKPWHEHSPNLCLTSTIIPSSKVLYMSKHLSGLIDVSEHDFCISCYSAYIHVCSNVAKLFKLTLDSKKEFTIFDLHNEIKHLQEEIDNAVAENGKDAVNDWLVDVEQKLLAILACLQQRMYHHKVCTKPTQTVTIEGHQVRVGSMSSNEQHDVFIMQLCFQVNQLYQSYTTLIAMHDMIYRKQRLPYKDKVKVPYEIVFHNCERKFSSIKVTDENVLDSKALVELRKNYVLRKTLRSPNSMRKVRAISSHVKNKKAYSIRNLKPKAQK